MVGAIGGGSRTMKVVEAFSVFEVRLARVWKKLNTACAR